MNTFKRITLGLAALVAVLSFDAAHPAGAQLVNRVTGPGIIDVAGAGYVNVEGQKASYYAALGSNTPAATPTDIAILTGSATKTIKVTRVRITVQATAAGIVEYKLIHRSGGTQSAVNTAFANGTHSGAYDTTDVASTVIAAGLAGVYTSNPASVGTVLGNVADWTTGILANGGVELVYTCTVPSKCITLRGATQFLAVSGAGHTLLTGEKVGVEFAWSEE